MYRADFLNVGTDAINFVRLISYSLTYPTLYNAGLRLSCTTSFLKMSNKIAVLSSYLDN